MFIGIGTLIFAKHPALHSLAEVTIIGMFSVVLMAFALPPIVFNWMVRQKVLTGVVRSLFLLWQEPGFAECGGCVNCWSVIWQEDCFSYSSGEKFGGKGC